MHLNNDRALIMAKLKDEPIFSRLEIMEAEFAPKNEQVEDLPQFVPYCSFGRHETGRSSMN